MCEKIPKTSVEITSYKNAWRNFESSWRISIEIMEEILERISEMFHEKTSGGSIEGVPGLITGTWKNFLGNRC